MHAACAARPPKPPPGRCSAGGRGIAPLPRRAAAAAAGRGTFSSGAAAPEGHRSNGFNQLHFQATMFGRCTADSMLARMTAALTQRPACLASAHCCPAQPMPSNHCPSADTDMPFGITGSTQKQAGRAHLLLLAAEERQQGHTRHLHHLEAHAGDITHGVAAAAETGDEHLVL